jgi:hypothetical protein
MTAASLRGVPGWRWLRARPRPGVRGCSPQRIPARRGGRERRHTVTPPTAQLPGNGSRARPPLLHPALRTGQFHGNSSPPGPPLLHPALRTGQLHGLVDYQTPRPVREGPREIGDQA